MTELTISRGNAYCGHCQKFIGSFDKWGQLVLDHMYWSWIEADRAWHRSDKPLKGNTATWPSANGPALVRSPLTSVVGPGDTVECQCATRQMLPTV
jgi:hypothetical protein